jgi:NAD(P)-dependent dehydrogenase (short-subunit alcohol dehydrogenase family)
MMQRFAGHVVVVTGAATGIGEATALRFAQEKARVACLDVNDEANEATAAACRELGVPALTIHCDVSSREDQQRAIARVVDEWGRVDTLVASAGIYASGPLPEVPLARWHRLLEINLTGVLLSNQAVAPIMMEQRSGSIINVSSMAGKTSFPNSAEYSASKSGVIGLTRSVAMELGPYGVTANAICPGNTLTDMVRSVAATVGGGMGMTGEAWLEMRANDTALKRLAEPWEMAGVIAFLASEDARYITGQSIEVDGGIILS